MSAAIFVIAFMLDGMLSFDDTLVWFEATPDADEADSRAYTAGHKSGLLERILEQCPEAKPMNDYVIHLTLGSQS